MPTPIPALVTILLGRERELKRRLSKEEVLQIRDKCACMMLPAEMNAQLSQNRGYRDVSLDTPWEDWCEARRSFEDLRELP